MRLLLALDLSSTVGWALVRRTSPPSSPAFGTLPLKGSVHERLGQFYDWLPDFHRLKRFEALAWEQPVLMRTDTVDKLLILYGLVGIAHGFACSLQMRWHAATVAQVKLAVAGNAWADKEAMVASATMAGWEVANHHEADAGGVGVVSYPLIFPAPVAEPSLL